MLKFNTITILLFIAALFVTGCAKESSQLVKSPVPVVSDDGRVEVVLNLSSPDGVATKGSASAQERAIAGMSMFVFFEDGTLDFKEDMSSSQINALSSTGNLSISAKLFPGTSIIWFLANMDVNGITKESDLIAKTVFLPSTPTSFPMSAREEVSVSYAGEGVLVCFGLKRLATKVRISRVTNGSTWPTTSSVQFIAAYLCNAATAYSIGGPASDPRWVNQEGLRNHLIASLIGRDPYSDASVKVRNYYESLPAFEELKAIDPALYHAQVDAAMAEWEANPYAASMSVVKLIDVSEYGGSGGFGMDDTYMLTYTTADGLYGPSSGVGSQFLYYPESSLLGDFSYPLSESMMHVFKRDCVIGVGESVDINKDMYCMPNPLTNPNAGYHTTFIPTSTVLMVVAKVGASKYWYPIPFISGGLSPNTEYDVSITITDAGNSAATWFNPVPDKVSLGFSVTVKDWVSGGSYSEVL